MTRKNSGMGETSEYNRWNAMLQRCYNPNVESYARYGARGIKVCERWHEFENFYADMGPAPAGMTLERERNDEDYSPKNCKWATRSEQARNRRSNIVVTYDGVTACLLDHAKALGLPYKAVHLRVSKYGWSAEEALRTPINVKRNENHV